MSINQKYSTMKSDTIMIWLKTLLNLEVKPDQVMK